MLSQFVFVVKVKTRKSFGPHEISVLIELALRNYVLIQHVATPVVCVCACVSCSYHHIAFFRTKTTRRKVGVELFFFYFWKVTFPLAIEKKNPLKRNVKINSTRNETGKCEKEIMMTEGQAPMLDEEWHKLA